MAKKLLVIGALVSLAGATALAQVKHTPLQTADVGVFVVERGKPLATPAP